MPDSIQTLKPRPHAGNRYLCNCPSCAEVGSSKFEVRRAEPGSTPDPAHIDISHSAFSIPHSPSPSAPLVRTGPAGDRDYNPVAPSTDGATSWLICILAACALFLIAIVLLGAHCDGYAHGIFMTGVGMLLGRWMAD